MRTSLDFTPLYRSGIGFDRVLDLLENAGRAATVDSWPPYDIVRTGEDAWRIAMAVAGFSQDELTVTLEPNLLVVRGAKSGEETAQYLHRGIAGRAFERRFELADHVRVAGASLENGLLTIDLVRELPEAMKPQRIALGTGQPKAETQQIEGEKAAA